MHIVHIASELAPIAKVGGLADVLLGLSRELSWKGHDVDIILPKYDCMNSHEIRDLSIENPNLLSYYDGTLHPNSIWVGWVENLKVYFVDPHHPRFFFNRGCFYGCEDDIDRYLYFSRAAMEFLYKKHLKPDVVHLHDWQTAAIAPLYKDIYHGMGFRTKIVFTIHNLEYQGKCSPGDIDRIGLKPATYLQPDKLQDPVYPRDINLLKGALVFSDYITTVSPTYAKEVRTPEGGRGLDSVLNQYKDKFRGILNGLDYSYWNPEIDRLLPVHFSPREVPENKQDHATIDKKGFIKKTLRERLMLAEEHMPIVGCITRLVPQKGIEMIKHALPYTLAKGGQFVLLGSSPIQSINAEFHELKRFYMDHPHVHINLYHNEELAHLIYAASDMFIVPSIFEPCGLTQLIALKYGAVPIVRRTGGLADTIFDVDNSGKPLEETNGYTFDLPDNSGLESAMDRAIEGWFRHPDKWRKLMINGMKIDYSWNRPSNHYLDIYAHLQQN
jgi:starch synthase